MHVGSSSDEVSLFNLVIHSGKSFNRKTNINLLVYPTDTSQLPPPKVITQAPISSSDTSTSTLSAGVAVVTTDTPVQLLEYCAKEEPALCGQPNMKTGYLPKSICLQQSTASICPAMCNLCTGM